MMKITITLVFLLNVFLVRAQNRYAEIKYSFTINSEGNSVVLDCALLYNTNKNISTFINFGFEDIPEDTRTEEVDINGNLFVNISKYNNNEGQKPEYQKNFGSNTLVAHESIFGEKKYHLISEQLPRFKWEILDDTLTLLGQKTQKAQVHFRGRVYFAWFTTQIKISDGPYKFHGLPGLILKIQSADKKYTFEAYAIKLNVIVEKYPIIELTEKYPKKNQVTLQEKITLTQKNIEKERKYRLSNDPNATEVKIEHSGIELNFDDVLNED